MLGILLDTKSKKRLVANFISLSVLRGIQFLIPLLTLPYLVRTIGLEKYGLINFALSLGLYFGSIIQFGFGITATREIARHRDQPAKLIQIYCATLTASVLLSVFSAILFSAIVLYFDEFYSHLGLYLSTLTFVVFKSLFPIWFFQGMEKMKYITILNLGTSALFLISLLVFVKHEEDFVLVPIINAVAAFITFATAIILIKKQFNLPYKRPKMQDIIFVYQSGYHAFISQLAPNLYNNSSVFLLGLFYNNTIVGLYAASTKVIDAVISFSYVLSNTFLPHLARNLQRHVLFQKIMLASGLALTIATVITARWISELLLNSGNQDVAIYIRCLAICILLLFLTRTYGANYLMLIGKDKAVKHVALYTSLVFFGVALFIIPAWGIWGAITVLVGARFTMAVLQIALYQKYKNVELAS